jgi:hypothetical protein
MPWHADCSLEMRKEKDNENQDESESRQSQHEVVNLGWPGPRGPEDVAKERKEKGNENQDESEGRQSQHEVVNLGWPGPRGPEDGGDNKCGIVRRQENLKPGFRTAMIQTARRQSGS